MRFLTFTLPIDHSRLHPQPARAGILLENTVIDLRAASDWAEASLGLPSGENAASMFELINAGQAAWQRARNLINALEGENPLELKDPDGLPVGYPLDKVGLEPPLPRPMSLRDFYAFEQHVVTANANRNKTVPEEWYRFPVFYFSNPNAIYGPEEVVPCPAYTQELDYELEVACVIGKPGINIPPNLAEEFIFGYLIFNDWSARDIQRDEMRVGLGPAKGKDFASSLGPWIVTPDELAAYKTDRPGVYDCQMTAKVNGEPRSHGNWKDLYYSFGEILARASQEVYLLPGDIIGSGTVGTGCLLEITKGQGPWLQSGDFVALEIEGLGILRNQVGESTGLQVH
jgi:fumarylacetoacetate (FAA) hydrolase